jgi:adenosylcobinamide-GDP ribazoletransferase
VLKDLINDILLTFSLLTRIPVKADGRIEQTPIYFVLIGYSVGFSYAILFFLANIINFHPPFSTIIIMALVYYFFELFHFDGLLDTLDGFLCQKKREDRLRIMKKGNIGPFALFYGVLFLIAHFHLLSLLSARALYIFIAGPISRWSMVLMLAISRPAKEEGLGASLFPFKGKRLIFATFYLIPLFILMPLESVISISIATLVIFIMKWISHRLVSGITGDIIGGSCLLVEVFILLALISYVTI